MKRKSIGLLLAALLAFTPTAYADLKIGYVNAARILDESPQAAAVTKKLKQEFSARQGDLLSDQKKLKQMEEKMARDGAVMSTEERSKLEREVVVQKRDLQNASDAFRDDLNLRRNEEMNKLLAVVQQTIEGIGKEQKFDLIVYEGVAYASPAIDLTDKVLEKLRASGNATDTAATPQK